MSRRGREIETLLLAMFAALPLYLTQVIGMTPLIAFHVFMGLVVLRVVAGKSPELVPAKVMRAVAILYVPFYVIDAAMISRSAIAASTHLVLFIATYQPSEALSRNNQAQRLLTTGLIFTASLATSTHITIVLFVIAFAWFMFRQMMYVSHMETVRALGRSYDEAPSGRSATFYLAGATLIGTLMFPILPRVRNPLVQGMSGTLPGATTGLSESIDFSEPRQNPNDSALVARVWVDPSARPFAVPVRLRGTVYDHYEDGEWKQSHIGLRHFEERDGTHYIARPLGPGGRVTVEMRPMKGQLFLPVGTYSVSGLQSLYEGPSRDTYHLFQVRGEAVTFRAQMAYQTEPLRLARVATTGYPVTPEIAALARQIVNGQTEPEKQAVRIVTWMLREFRYVADPADISRPSMSLDDFLLRDRAGHCEYFAAGTVALLTALDVPARVVGGFYGGRYNPLAGFHAIRREDAHAWVEMWNGTRWVTYDSTPPSLRPGGGGENPLLMLFGALGESITYFWDRYVLTFGLGDQIALFTEAITRGRDLLIGAKARVTSTAQALAAPRMLLLVGGIAALAAVVFLLARRKTSLFDLLAAQLRTRGIEVGRSMTMEEALQTLRAQQPEAARELAPLIALYEEERFSAREDRGRASRLRRALADLPR
ncbi:MAG TPA: transglutaminase domain-containing protein [Thermoanaerobaculia bacterium]|jgi:transglutaminase-like putative cysteine protease